MTNTSKPLLLLLLRAAALLLPLLGWQPVHADAPERRYTILMTDGRPAGSLHISSQPGGDTVARYIFKDNGRGPETVERYRLADDGTPLAYQVNGSSTFGSVIDERYTRQAGRVVWRSAADAGEAAETASKGPALYAAMAGSPALDAVALAALARAPQRSLPLWPSGMLQQQVLDRFVLRSAGREQALALVAHTGLGFSPNYLWATDEAQPRLFAALVPGYCSLIEDTWAAVLPQLVERQLNAQRLLMAQRAAAWRHPLPGLTVLRNARVFDSMTASLGGPSDVYVYRGRITAVRPAGSQIAETAQTADTADTADTEIDAAGRVLLPGLFDMHDHAWRGAGGLHLAAGITTVRDMANDNATLAQIVDETERGVLAYPQIVPAGFIEGESPFASRQGFVIKTRDEALAAVDWYALRGIRRSRSTTRFRVSCWPRPWPMPTGWACVSAAMCRLSCALKRWCGWALTRCSMSTSCC